MEVTVDVINKYSNSPTYVLKNAKENTILHYAPNKWKTEKEQEINKQFEKLKLSKKLQQLRRASLKVQRLIRCNPQSKFVEEPMQSKTK